MDSDSGLSDDFAGGDSEEDADGDRHDDSGSHPTEGGDNGPPVKRSKLSKAELYKPPTNEEMHQLRETENLFHSNLFRLQVTCSIQSVSSGSKGVGGFKSTPVFFRLLVSLKIPRNCLLGDPEPPTPSRIPGSAPECDILHTW